MKFEFIEYNNRKVSDDELLNDMKRVVTEYKLDSLTQSKYTLYGKYDCSTIIRRFGTWNNGLIKAGISVTQQFWTEEELFLNIENVWIKKGSQPRRRDMDDKDLSTISSGAYLRKYGKWTDALIAFVNYINEDGTDKINEANNINTIEINNHKTKRDINLRLRFKVLQRDKFKCCACGASPAKDSSVELQVDHIIPYSKGGETIEENLQTLCSKCNSGKSNVL